jgi:BirA family biotin operon repressor/biotin-[acetyl-CoA-carboxylase] ligase
VRELSPDSIRNGLSTQLLGRKILCFHEIPSTSSTARRLAEARAPEGTLVVTDSQTEGRGRMGRQWICAPRTGLLFSVILRPHIPPSQLHAVAMVCGLGIKKAIEDAIGLSIGLKWPNDVLCNHRKVGGILIEASTRGVSLDYVIAGIGLNVSSYPQTLSQGIAVTSLEHELGHHLDRADLLQRILEEIETDYFALRNGHWPDAAWSAALETLGTMVTIHTSTGVLHGTAIGIDSSGALLVRQGDGSVQAISCGDVT